MAYSTRNPPNLVADVLSRGTNGEGRSWNYVSTDSLLLVQEPGYFSNGFALGIRKNDTIKITDTNSSPVDVLLMIVESDADRVITLGLVVKEAEGTLQSEKYWLHINADTAFSGDARIRDKSLNLNDFIFGDDLSSAAALADPRFITTVNPTSGSPDSVMRAPALGYDYENNESILFFFKGKITPEGSNQVFMGDTFSTSTSGLAFRVRPTGQVDLFLGDDVAGGLFSGPTTGIVGDGETHSFALYLDGTLKSYKWYVDGAADSAMISYGGGVSRNTVSSNTFNVGSGSAFPGGSAGIATATNTLAILRSSTSLDIQRVDDTVAQLHIDGTKLVSNSL